MKSTYALLLLIISFSCSAEVYLCKAKTATHISYEKDDGYFEKSPESEWIVNPKKGFYEVTIPSNNTPFGNCNTEQVMETKQLVCTQTSLSTFAINLDSLSFAYTNIVLGNIAVNPSVTSYTGVCHKIEV